MQIIDVGANHGQATHTHAILGHKVLMIEPTPALYEELKKKYEKHANVEIINTAVDIEEKEAAFHIAPQGDWGTSSLFTLVEDWKSYWPNRPDFEQKQSILVKTKRLDTICDNFEIKKIDYLKIDTQGNDLNVLKSLGSMRTRKGLIEVSKIKTYVDQNNNIDQVVQYLKDNSYRIIKVTKNDICNNEFNILFIDTF